MRDILQNKYVHFVTLFVVAIAIAMFLIPSKQKKIETFAPSDKSSEVRLKRVEFDSMMTVLLKDSASTTRKLLDSLIQQKNIRKQDTKKVKNDKAN